MIWYIVTSDASAHIRPAQEWLFKKYAPGVETHYINLGKNHFRLNKWGQDVCRLMPDDEFCVFGLDDYLPTGPLKPVRLEFALLKVMEYDLDRFELGYGAHNKAPFTKGVDTMVDHGSWLAYGTDHGAETPYSVSCQFAIWKTSALKSILHSSTNPWNFETKHRCWAGCFPKCEHAFTWIEESALSKRWKGINVKGMRPEDVNELIGLGLLDERKLINRDISYPV